ncbi:MAG: hypothetical protein ABIL16_03690 [candidate division WOR-3 bacterium]
MKKFLFLIPLTFWGCFFGTFQTAQPINQGEIDFGLYFNFPAYLTQESKNAAIYNNYAILPYGGIFAGVGATKNLGVGLGASFLGIGPYAKWTVYKFPRYESYISLVPKLYVDVFSTSMLTPQLDMIFGAKANRVISWYIGYQVMYSASEYIYNPLLSTDTFKIPGAIRRIPNLHQYISFGIDLTGKFRGQKSDIPYGLRIEFGGSYFYADGTYYPFINLGIALTGGSALGVLTLAAKEPTCCFYATAMGYSWLLNAYRTPTEDEKKKPKKETGTKQKDTENGSSR